VLAEGAIGNLGDAIVCYLHQRIMSPVIIRLPKTTTSNKTTITVPMMIKAVFVLLVLMLFMRRTLFH
jgi:hypothetical protein